MKKKTFPNIRDQLDVSYSRCISNIEKLFRPFMIDPNQFDLQEKEQKIGYIEVFHTVPGPSDLIYYCFSIDKTTKFHKVFEVKFTAHFEDPVLVLSQPSLHFRMDNTVDEIVANLQGELLIR